MANKSSIKNNADSYYKFRSLFTNCFGFIPIWKSTYGNHIEIIKRKDMWFLKKQNLNIEKSPKKQEKKLDVLLDSNVFELEKIKKIQGLNFWLFYGGILFSIVALLSFFVYGSKILFISYQFFTFSAFTLIFYLILFAFRNKRIFLLGMFLTLMASLFIAYNFAGFKGLYYTTSIYCALYFVLSFSFPVLIEKIGYSKKIKENNSETFCFNVKDKKGIMIIAYIEDRIPEEELEILSIKSNISKNNIQNKAKEDYDFM